MQKHFKFMVTGCLIMWSLNGLAWREVGNGGDYVRSQFLRAGEVVMKYLSETQEGQALVQDQQLDPSVLFATLDVAKIKVVDIDLVDNTSSIVDAIGTPGMILLNHQKWLNHFSLDRDVYHLVFHEMLRSAQVNDDNYVIAKFINPFPLQRRINTSLTTLYPLVKGSVKDFLQGQIGFAGSGCLSTLDDHFIDFDSEWNTLTLNLENFNLKSDDNSPLARKACSLTVPIQLPPQYRLEVTQAEFSTKFESQGIGTLRTHLEVFNAGGIGTPSSESISIQDGQKGRLLVRTANVYRSECGFAGNFRLNSSVVLQQQGGTLFANADRVKLYFNLVPCSSLVLLK
jgi:hypothetical protein